MRLHHHRTVLRPATLVYFRFALACVLHRCKEMPAIKEISTMRSTTFTELAHNWRVIPHKEGSMLIADGWPFSLPVSGLGVRRFWDDALSR